MAALRQHDELERQRRERQRASRTPTDQEIDAANASMHEVMEQQMASFGGGRSHIEVPQSTAGDCGGCGTGLVKEIIVLIREWRAGWLAGWGSAYIFVMVNVPTW